MLAPFECYVLSSRFLFKSKVHRGTTDQTIMLNNMPSRLSAVLSVTPPLQLSFPYLSANCEHLCFLARK